MARRILLADDSVTAQNMGRRILHDAGYEVTTVNNGSAALKRIAELKPDLIILDVYMPGYGGLEVCSRLKENKDTARIPVLLTVGKLEPFKPEEARRVRADAYIVKPFEASELLTALTKLEDKIVPGPEPYKQGRFAKAMAAVEHTGSEADFGDQETGWKDRLIIPGGKKKKDKDVGPEPEPIPAKGFRSVVREEEFRPAEPKKEFERPMPAGLPQDIKPEEIAAIAAAAAKINGKSAEVETPAPPVEETKSWPVTEASTPVAEAVAPENVAEEVPAATFASAHEEEPPAKAEFEVHAAPAEATAEPVVESTTEPVEATPELAVSPPEAVAEAGPAVEAAIAEAKPDAEEEKRPVSDAEVLAALASLTPAGAEFEVPATPQTDAAVGASFTGPRWAAEAVAVAEDESTTLLEHEMEKACAAFAAADAALATPVEAVMPTNGNGHSAEAVVEEPAKSEEIVANPESTSAPVEAVATETVAPVVEEAAYAAAASASAATTDAIIENQPVASAASSGSTEPEEGSRVREAELAAAWANWRQIRESIVGEQPTTHVEDAEAGFREMPVEAPAEVAAETFAPAEAVQESAIAEPQPEAHEEQPAAEVQSAIQSEAMPAEAAPAEAPEQDPGEISSIVDNMLAELKPKLMEELKRKLKK